MSKTRFSKCLFFFLAASVASSSLIGEESVDSCPSKETSRYLGELLRRNIPGISDVGVIASQSFTPIELLFDEEVLRPRFGPPLTRTAHVTMIVELPEKCLYLTKPRLKSIGTGKTHYSVLPIKYIHAYAVVHESEHLKDGSVNIVTTTIEGSFREQSDLDSDGKWDRESCWEVMKSTRTGRVARPNEAIPTENE